MDLACTTRGVWGYLVVGFVVVVVRWVCQGCEDAEGVGFLWAQGGDSFYLQVLFVVLAKGIVHGFLFGCKGEWAGRSA